VKVPETEGAPVMVTTFADQLPVTSAGRPANVAPVAVVVVYVIFVSAVLIQSVCASVPDAELLAMVLFGVTVIVPVIVFVPPVQPPVIVTVYVKVPDTEGVPVMVTTFADQFPVTPPGRPVTVAPVAVVVAYVMLVIAVLIHRVCASVPTAELRAIVLVDVTVMVPVAVFVPPVQPPVIATV
jgi:hypothetical protein